MSSKWNYIFCGINITFGFVGALTGNFPLLGIGVGFAIFNWYAAEARRKVEEQEYGKDNEESK